MKSESLVVTGVSGFIGRHVAREAMRRGYRVSGIDRCPCAPLEGVECIVADTRDQVRMKEVMQGKTCVIHLAAITSNIEFRRTPAECYDVNVNGFLSVIDAAAQGGCQRFVYASSAAVYERSFVESVVIDVRQQRNHYAKTKLMNEMTAQSYQDLFGMATVGLRFFNVYGHGENAKGNYASIIGLLTQAKKRGERLVLYGDGTQARDLIDVRDAARVTLDLLESGVHEIYNVGTGVATPYRNIAEMIDREGITYVPNPLESYQWYTCADVDRLAGILRARPLRRVEEGIVEMLGTASIARG